MLLYVASHILLMNAKAALLLSTPYNFAGHILAEKVSSYSKEPESKSFYISRAVSYFYELESEIWTGLGQMGSLDGFLVLLIV